MTIRRRQRNGIENSSALSDMAFLLIIYFIVIAGFNVNQGFLMNLPAKDSVKMVPRESIIRFSLDEGGVIFFQGNAVSTAQAEQEIRSVIGARSDAALVLSVNGSAPWQSVVSFVELAQKLAVENFSFSLAAVNSGALE